MNLFRSKEDAQDWSEFKPGTEDGILPLTVAADLLCTPRHRDRLNPRYVSTAAEAAATYLAHLSKLTDGSPYWDPKAV
jgi:hypothetical protein